MADIRIEMASLVGASGINYCDGKILFAYRYVGFPEWIVGVRPNFALSVCCRRGECVVVMDGKEYRINGGCLFVVEDVNIVAAFEASPDFECDIMGYSWGVLEEMPSFLDAGMAACRVFFQGADDSAFRSLC